MRWGHDLPEELAPLSFIFRARTVPLRNLGGCMSPDNAWMVSLPYSRDSEENFHFTHVFYLVPALNADYPRY